MRGSLGSRSLKWLITSYPSSRRECVCFLLFPSPQFVWSQIPPAQGLLPPPGHRSSHFSEPNQGNPPTGKLHLHMILGLSGWQFILSITHHGSWNMRQLVSLQLRAGSRERGMLVLMISLLTLFILWGPSPCNRDAHIRSGFLSLS